MLFSLMEIASESDRDLIEQLYVKYRRLVFSVAKRILLDQQLAEDAVHETFLKIIHYLERFRTYDCNDMAGLIVIMSRNVSIDLLNRQHKKRMIFIADVIYDETIEHEDPDDQLIALESHRELLVFLNRLPEHYRDTLFMKHLFGFSNAEIANIMNIKPDSVRVWLHRAKMIVLDQWRQHQAGGGDRDAHESS